MSAYDPGYKPSAASPTWTSSTVRTDWRRIYAGQIAAALVASCGEVPSKMYVAEYAVKVADRLIKELDKEPKQEDAK